MPGQERLMQPIDDVKQQLMEIINSSDDPETAEE